ncbi:hypothetical protein CYLTODRAFT_426306 [Cylindrobasidium torrendii FP15055 ss-10]|uniref:Uncharacterized protein n=1 Tax=Cylindrobasidium torrendii FP15055 ss-10 TaxID=1314674 RepID=A0A0D7AZ35_9AGAR|nr:hypothetical protein CYLTODRAFT_426306 [Cylindrobasidium torrendii FP15055 ss-10]
MLRRQAILPLGYIVLLSSHPIFADDGYEQLNNGKGKTPCDLADEIEDCALSSRALASRFPNASNFLPRSHQYPRDSPDPSDCTCTNVYFNTHSACLSIQNNPTITADEWRAKCQAANLQVKNKDFEEYEIPAWAHVDLPEGSHTFDIASALRSVSPTFVILMNPLNVVRQPQQQLASPPDGPITR